MHTLTNPVVTLGLSVLCAFLPSVYTVLAAAALILGHVYSVSLGMLIVTAVIFLIMFVFYLRLAPGTAIVVLLMFLAHLLDVPMVIPIACGLLGSMAYAVPMVFGTVIFYVVNLVKDSAATLQTAGAEGFISGMADFAKQAVVNKEMWLIMIAGVISMLAVYGIRRSGIAHAWKLASAAGVVIYMIIMTSGGTVLDVETSVGELGKSAVAAVVVGLILELLFFAVDYSKCENLQYEDDEYYYYVKAVPKVGVAATNKKVKKINRRQEEAASEVTEENTEQELFQRSLRRDLNLDEDE